MSNNSNDTSTILKEAMVYNYVAGELSNDARLNFEKQLELDSELQLEVAEEVRLREVLGKVNSAEPASNANFADLLSKIEQEDTSLSSVIDQSRSQSSTATGVIAFPGRQVRQFGIAACLALVGIVSVSFFVDLTQPNFTTLSNETASSQVDFKSLADQGRLAKISLSAQLTDTQINQLLEQYSLQTFESGADQQNMYVYMDKAISATQLDALKSDRRIKRIEKFTQNDEN